MADKFWARKQNDYKVVGSAPSVNKTQMGSAVVPVPYPVTEKMGSAKDIAMDVELNGNPAYHHASNSSKVKGDGKGKLGGVVSGTVEAKSEPIPATASKSVKTHNKFIVREGDLQKMQGGNTIGKITCKESGSTSTITDEGAIEGDTLPPDLDLETANDLYQQAGQPVPRQAMPRATKPTASSGSGGLGCTTGSPVVLQTGQSHYEYDYSGVTLAGAFEIPLSLTYISDQDYKGFFGRNRRFCYEKQFRHIGDNRYRLYREDGREFDFVETADGFTDTGNLGVEVSRRDDQFILDYFSEPTEIYQDGQLMQVRDRNHNTLDFSYQANGALTRIENNSGSSLKFHYNQRYQVTRLTDHSGRTWQADYDEDYNLIAITNPIGASERYEYSASNDTICGPRLSRITNPEDVPVLQLDYDEAGRVSAWREGQRSYRYFFHGTSTVEKIDHNSQCTLYGLDQYGLIDGITYPDGRMSHEHYDPATRTARITIRDGETRTERYDERNRIVSVNNGCCGQSVIYHYEGKNPEPVTVIDDYKEITNQYDERYNLTSVETAGGSIDRYEYDSRGNISKTIDPEGNETGFHYNDRDQLARITDPRGFEHRFEYDSLSRQTAAIDPEDNRHGFSYDALDNCIEHHNPLGDLIAFHHNHNNQLDQITDPAGNANDYRYGQQGELISQQQGDQSQRHCHYNADGLLDAIRREDGSELLLSYNNREQITRIMARQKTDDGSATHPEYREQTLAFEHDKDGDLVSASLNDQALSLEYDSESKLISSLQQGIKVSRWYDDSSGEHAGTALLGRSFYHLYDEAGNISQIQCGLDRIKQSFSATGQITEREYPNCITEKHRYDEAGNVIEITNDHASLDDIEYSINSTGLISQKNDIEYRYDPSGRLIQAGDEHFDYDNAGNILNNEAKYNPHNNRLLSNKDYYFSYDGRGNLVSKLHKQTQQTTWYSYSLFDQLLEVLTTDSNNQVTGGMQFRYDALNRRISKRVKNDDTDYTHHYLYDLHNIVAILDQDKKLLATLVHGDEIDTPLSITTYDHEPLPLTDIEQGYFDDLSEADQLQIMQNKTERTYYYHRDHQGSIIALTDQDGTIVEEFEYNGSYGEILSHTQTVETYNPYCYTGREYDANDLYYYRARYYDPQIKRFISPDPIGFLSGETNLYSYVGNDPVNFTDPSGCGPCDYIRKKIALLYKKAIAPLKRLLAKQVLKLGAAAAPVVGWFMAAWTAYDLVTLGLQLKELLSKSNLLEAALQKCLSKTKKSKSTKSVESNKVTGKKTNNVPKGTTNVISKQKQAGHIPGTPQNANRIKQGKPTSSFFGEKSGERLTQQAFDKGKPVPGRPNVREHDFGVSTGTGPNGGMQTRVRVHQDSKGRIHGHPSGLERF